MNNVNVPIRRESSQNGLQFIDETRNVEKLKVIFNQLFYFYINILLYIYIYIYICKLTLIYCSRISIL